MKATVATRGVNREWLVIWCKKNHLFFSSNWFSLCLNKVGKLISTQILDKTPNKEIYVWFRS